VKIPDMIAIRLSFLIDLRDFKQEYFNEFYGPAFHRFLPDNKLDKIERKLTSFDGLISFWFEKRGILSNSYIKYDNKKKLINEDLIPKQAILDAGPLFGEVTINKLSTKLKKVLEDNRTGNSEYVSFAKKLVKEITEYSNDLINIFRYLYKQYWIKNIDIWDSRYQSLGSFCKRDLSMQYSLDNGKTWKTFLPDEERHVVHLESNISDDYSDYISQNDWYDIKALYKSDFKATIASVFLTQANSTYDNGDLKKAFIETVTALEIAIEQVINKNPKITNSILKSIQSFKSIPRNSQFSLIAMLCENIYSNEIENSLKAIDIRNSIVHNGYNPKATDSKYLKSLLFSISKIIKEPVTKLPSVNRGNAIMSIESWEKAKKKIKN
jgi:hypothetical protein